MSRPPLHGVRVLDASILFPANYCAAMLGELGADVVKVEPPEGEPLRRMGVFRDGYPTVWAVAGRNKRSIMLDLTTDDDRRRLMRLAGVADVVVVNQPIPILERWGLTHAAVSSRNPGVITVSLTGFGAAGPMAGQTASGSMAEAFAGLTHLVGDPEGPPGLLSVPLGDCLAAISATNATLAALVGRQASGAGQNIDLAMYESVLPVLATTMAAWEPTGPPPGRTGGHIAGGTPRNTYTTRDGRWVALTGATAPQLERLLHAMGRHEDIDHFVDEDGRRLQEAALDVLISQWIGDRDAAEVLSTLAAARLPASLVHDFADVVAHPQVVARGSVVETEQPGLGRVILPAPAPWLDDAPRSPAPALGEHGRDVARDWLGDEAGPGAG